MKPQAPHDTTELGRGGNACIAAVPNQFGGELPVSAGLLELFLIVLVILCIGLCVIEKTGCHRPCCPKPVLKAHQRDHVPPTPPVETFLCARTVLAFKGSLRRAKLRRALDGCAPFRPTGNRDGRLRREHDAIPWNQKPKPRPLKGLDRSLHIRFWDRILAECSQMFRNATQ